MAAILLVALAVKVALVVIVPVTADECLHWLQGQELAWGFSDHPPGTAALSRLSTALLGNTPLGVRLVPILGSLLCSGIAYAMLREVGADRRRAATAAAFVQLLPMVGVGMLMVPTVPHAPLVFAAEYALLRALRRGRIADHVLWGALLGAAFLTYYLTAAAALAGAVFLVRDPRGRRALRDPRLWLGGAIAVAVFAPNLLWNFTQGERSAVHFQLLERGVKRLAPQFVAAFLALAVALAGPLLLPALRRAARALRSGAADAGDWRPLFASFLLVVLVLFAAISVTTKVGAHWAVLAYLNVPLLLFAPQAEPLARGWPRSAMLVGGVLAAVVACVAAIGFERVTTLMPVLRPAKRERFFHVGDAGAMAQRLALDLSHDGHLVQLACDRWSLASQLTFHAGGATPFAVYPPATRHGRDFGTWFPGNGAPVELIYVTTTPEVDDAVRAASTSVQRVATVGRDAEFAWIHRCLAFLPPADWR